MSAPEDIGTPTCEDHLNDPCDCGHRATRRDCDHCPPHMRVPHEICVYCQKLPRIQQHLLMALAHISDYEHDRLFNDNEYDVQIAKRLLVRQLNRLQGEETEGKNT